LKREKKALGAMAGPDIKSFKALPTPILGGETLAPEPDTKNLDALLASLNGSAERFQTLWFSFLGLTLYFAIAALTTTHRDLLLGEPKTLPLLNIQVPLLPFYVIAPLLFLVFHFYLLMMLALLARTAAEFDKHLRTTLPDDAQQERYRARIGNALFLQLFVGMKGERAGLNALLMGLIALITIVLAPLATLVLMQMMFLPYHHLRITWWHRGIVVADLMLIVVMTYRCFFPRGVRKAPLVLGALRRKPRWAMAMAFCVLLAVALAPLTYWLSFKEGRWAGEPRPSSVTEWGQWMAGTPPSIPVISPDYTATANGVVFGLFPDRLNLRSETIVADEQVEKTKKEMTSRGGSFVPTVKLDDRDLQAADLSGADLRGVSLEGANMGHADLSGVQLQGADLTVAQLRAFLGRAHLEGARLTKAELKGAYLGDAKLQGADLQNAQMTGADLGQAQLQGADLFQAQLQGANLQMAHLEGSDLGQAQLQGADLFQAQLQGANLEKAQLQGADLYEAQLQGADLEQAQLQAADLIGSQLQGSRLYYAEIECSNFDGAFVFRSPPPPDLWKAKIGIVNTDQVKAAEILGRSPTPMTAADVDGWTNAATQFARLGQRDRIVNRFDRLKNGSKATDQDAMEADLWKYAKQSDYSHDPVGAHHSQCLEKFLGDLACDAFGAPYVARQLVRDRPARLGDQLVRIKTAKSQPDTCKGVAGFTEEDWRRLEAIKPD
jgi:uncharacterized protein YjbI with pentapeptide repeats